MIVNGAHLIIAAGVLASPEVEVEAVDRVQNGWIVIKGYENDLTPILTLVADVHVVDILVAAEPTQVTIAGLTYRAHNWNELADEEIENILADEQDPTFDIQIIDDTVFSMAA